MRASLTWKYVHVKLCVLINHFVTNTWSSMIPISFPKRNHNVHTVWDGSPKEHVTVSDTACRNLLIDVLFSMSFPALLIAFQTRPSRNKAEHHQSSLCAAGTLVVHSPQEFCHWLNESRAESEKIPNYVSLLTQWHKCSYGWSWGFRMIKSQLPWQLSVGCEVFSAHDPEAGEKQDSSNV